MTRYNVFYDTPDGTNTYCLMDMSKTEAETYLIKFKERYFDENGKGKRYPNGKGYYPFTNPRIEKVRG